MIWAFARRPRCPHCCDQEDREHYIYETSTEANLAFWPDYLLYWKKTAYKIQEIEKEFAVTYLDRDKE